MKQKRLNDSTKHVTTLEIIGAFGQIIKDSEVQHFYESLDGLAEQQKVGLAKARLAVESLPQETGVEADELIVALELLRDARKSEQRRYRPVADLLPSY